LNKRLFQARALQYEYFVTQISFHFLTWFDANWKCYSIDKQKLKSLDVFGFLWRRTYRNPEKGVKLRLSKLLFKQAFLFSSSMSTYI
jgi:hypothetical protein